MVARPGSFIPRLQERIRRLDDICHRRDSSPGPCRCTCAGCRCLAGPTRRRALSSTVSDGELDADPERGEQAQEKGGHAESAMCEDDGKRERGFRRELSR